MDVSDNHAQVVVCIVQDPGVRLREIGERVGERVGITERAAHRIVTELADAGDITRRRNGYTINAHLPLPDPIAREQNVGELLEFLTASHGSDRRVERTGTSG